MLAQATQANDRPLLILGLATKNLTELYRGRPAFKQLDSLGIEADLLVMSAETPEAMMELLQNPETEHAEGLSVEAAGLDLEYDVCLDGGFVGEATSDLVEAHSRAVSTKAENPDGVVTVLLSVRQ